VGRAGLLLLPKALESKTKINYHYRHHEELWHGGNTTFCLIPGVLEWRSGNEWRKVWPSPVMEN
jgi:hypothetical protein